MSYGNKGIIFTLDAIIAVIIIILVLSTAAFYTTRQPQSLTDLRTIRLSSDIITLLDNKNLLDSLDADSIQGNITKLLPANETHKMKVSIDCESTISFETPETIPDSGLVISGKRIFFVQDSRDFCTAQYWMWQE